MCVTNDDGFEYGWTVDVRMSPAGKLFTMDPIHEAANDSMRFGQIFRLYNLLCIWVHLTLGSLNSIYNL